MNVTFHLSHITESQVWLFMLAQCYKLAREGRSGALLLGPRSKQKPYDDVLTQGRVLTKGVKKKNPNHSWLFTWLEALKHSAPTTTAFHRCRAAFSVDSLRPARRHVTSASREEDLTATNLARQLVERRATGTRSAAAIGSSERQQRASWTHRGAGLGVEHQSPSVNTGRGKWDATARKTNFVFKIVIIEFTIRGHHDRAIVLKEHGELVVAFYFSFLGHKKKLFFPLSFRGCGCFSNCGSHLLTF